jgi:NodT family efflux transporter outer membrane factor (OMF) lipoprotein
MNNAPRLALSVATFTLLLASSACLTGPHYRRPDTPAPPSYKEASKDAPTAASPAGCTDPALPAPPAAPPAGQPSGWKAAAPTDAVPRGEWWKVYADPHLDALEAQVGISNQNLLAAGAQFRAAQAAVRISRSSLFPALTAAPSATRSGGGAATGNHRSYSIPFDATYQVDLWGGIRHGVASSTALAQASAADVETARLLYQSELATDYFEVQGLDATRHLLESTVTSYEHFAQLTQDRLDGGVASEGDVALAQTQLETARAQLADLGVQRAQFEHAIAVLIGRPPSELTLPDAHPQAIPPALPASVPSSLLERRPDIASAERQVAAANEQIGVSRAALFPSLILGVTAGLQSSSIVDLFIWPSRFWSVGPQLAATLFDAGKRRAQVRLSQADYDATVAYYRETVLTSFEQVEDALAQLRILTGESVIVDRAVTAANRSLQISVDQYRGGLTGYLQVITAQNFALQNQRAAVDLLTRRNVSSVALNQALGGGWDSSQLPSARDLRR